MTPDKKIVCGFVLECIVGSQTPNTTEITSLFWHIFSTRVIEFTAEKPSLDRRIQCRNQPGVRRGRIS